MVTVDSTKLQIQPQYGTEIRLKNLGKSFDSLQVLSNINLDIRPGEFVAIVGRSGCGKSTLLRLIAGLETPTSGEIRLDDRLLVGLNREARIMFQDARLLPWRRVLENVAIGSKRQGKQYGLLTLNQVGLGDRTKAWTTQLSGGQRQRVALARAL
ncbi:MAG: ATP-binding cassette domain-containing protein, partial [Microcoleus sp. SIO2G3]|nr:ATP-binding cassette domain-containing protein [Microcoleus sp. SIO2G3]